VFAFVAAALFFGGQLISFERLEMNQKSSLKLFAFRMAELKLGPPESRGKRPAQLGLHPESQ
jgi:hypothetical protein